MTQVFRYRSDEHLETIARMIISQYDPCLLYRPTLIPVEKIMKSAYGLKIEYRHIKHKKGILGETVFENAIIPLYNHAVGCCELQNVRAGTVFIDISLKHWRSYGRLRYTLAHELAHWVIDKRCFKNINLNIKIVKNASSLETDAAIERQADRLASRILMPKGMVKSAFHDNKQNPINALADLFGVSRQAMKIRLDELGLVE